ncbi:MAG: hypothetical protein WCY29_14080 [Novosphingobium sp.]
METPQPIPQPAARPTAPDDLPPWLREAPAPRTSRPRPARQAETVHWSVLVLMLFTATSVLIGTQGDAPAPRELLPIMVTAR